MIVANISVKLYYFDIIQNGERRFLCRVFIIKSSGNQDFDIIHDIET